MQEAHDINPRINPQPFVPLPDNPGVEESYKYLLELERDEGPDYEYRPRGAARKYPVRELLDGVRGSERPKPLPPPAPTIAPSPKKPNRTWTYLSFFFALLFGSGFWIWNIFGQETLSFGRFFWSLAVGGGAFYVIQLRNPEYFYMRWIGALLTFFLGIGMFGQVVKGLLPDIPLLHYFRPENQSSVAELAIWAGWSLTVFLALLAADFFSRHRRR